MLKTPLLCWQLLSYNEISWLLGHHLTDFFDVWLIVLCKTFRHIYRRRKFSQIYRSLDPDFLDLPNLIWTVVKYVTNHDLSHIVHFIWFVDYPASQSWLKWIWDQIQIIYILTDCFHFWRLSFSSTSGTYPEEENSLK